MSHVNKKIALFPGSFDPYTMGHHDIVQRGLQLFDEVIIALGHNSQKKRYFDLDLMKDKITGCYRDQPRITVETYTMLTAAYAREKNARFLLRGLRNTTDFEYENSIAQVNSELYTDLETVFLITSPVYAFISSSILREVHRYGGDISQYIPYSL